MPGEKLAVHSDPEIMSGIPVSQAAHAAGRKFVPDPNFLPRRKQNPGEAGQSGFPLVWPAARLRRTVTMV
jgi:hypothetical protein